MEKAAFGAGCFWGVQAAFEEVPGVIETMVGYSGGNAEYPTYEHVSSGKTGHAETVLVSFDPSVIPYAMLVERFFALHDPTQRDKQGPDVGSQYRSIIFYNSPEQERVARAVKDKLEQSKKYREPIATQIEPLQTFWRAEEYHQDYCAKKEGRNCNIGVINE